MTIAYSPYTLPWRHKPEANRKGALLRFSFADGCIGYADCFCWPEFGDAPLESQLELLAKGETTSLTKRAYAFARLDADARKQKINLFADLIIPTSHFLIPDLLHQGELPVATHYKVKIGEDLINEIPLLKSLMTSHPSSKFRLDFNGKVDQLTFEEFLQSTASFHHQIDFIEDPFPFDPKQWKLVQKNYGVPLALDRGASRGLGQPEVAQVLILKPAKHDESFFSNTDQRIVLTSYLDHPIGQLAAAYFAAKMGVKEPCGLISHQAYLPNPYSQRLKIDAHRLKPPLQGTGFGFDDLLRQEEWRPL